MWISLLEGLGCRSLSQCDCKQTQTCTTRHYKLLNHSYLRVRLVVINIPSNGWTFKNRLKVLNSTNTSIYSIYTIFHIFTNNRITLLGFTFYTRHYFMSVPIAVLLIEFHSHYSWFLNLIPQYYSLHYIVSVSPSKISSKYLISKLYQS